ncbi:SH3 domain-containing protein [Acinetobacter gerneri]|uniref:SH3 domain-containing protein n=1 Tax=Acinetobacter gerneri TaxID=202952 RepID=UPI00293678D5|nr:SH3 domain-containing protein [Acinetobacter gerneri]MDV2438237.1 SH3 domain-containing protein [Acinetobacter gerneri]
MRKITLFLLGLSMIPSLCLAEFALISDKDGYVNVRDEASLQSGVIGRLNNGTVVSVHDRQSNFVWVIASQLKDGGYVHQSRINPFKDFQRWKLTGHSADQAVYRLAQDTVTLKVKPAEFKLQDFKKSKKADSAETGYTHYKNQIFWGTDGEIPNHALQFKQIDIVWNGKTIVIPAEKLQHYFFPKDRLGAKYDFEQSEIYSKNNELYILNTLSTGGAAQYNLMIHIDNGQVKTIQAWSDQI